MKRIAWVILLYLLSPTRLWAQTDEIQQLLLNVEKLAQHRQILDDMKKGYERVTAGYSTIRDVSQGNFKLHHEFLEGLLEVSPAVRRYRRVGEIAELQVALVEEGKKAFSRFGREGAFSNKELNYLEQVYSRMLRHSLDQLELLTRVLAERQLRMTDEERLQAIDAIWRDMEKLVQVQRSFNRSTALLALQRAKEQRDLAGIRQMHGLKP